VLCLESRPKLFRNHDGWSVDSLDGTGGITQGALVRHASLEAAAAGLLHPAWKRPAERCRHGNAIGFLSHIGIGHKKLAATFSRHSLYI